MSIPKGYKLVPVEPTDEMLEVLHGSVKIQVDTWERTADIINDKEWWSAVVDSAPTPPQPIYDEAKERELFEVRIHRIAVEKGYEYMAFLLKRDVSGEYQTTWVDMAWLGWSECAQSRAKAVEVGHE